MVELLADEGAASSMAAAAAERVSTEFSVERMLSGTFAVYGELGLPGPEGDLRR
jgi:hypothetical protein